MVIQKQFIEIRDILCPCCIVPNSIVNSFSSNRLLAGEKKERGRRLNSANHKMITLKSFTTILGRFLTILSLIFLFFKLSQHLNNIPNLNYNLLGILSLISAVLFSASTVVIVSYIWIILLRGGGVFLNLKQAYIIIGKSQIGKYLPGNIFQYLGRITLGQRAGIPPEAIVMSTGVETLLLAGTASSIAAVGLFFDRNALMWLMGKLSANGYGLTVFAIVVSVAILFALAILLPRTRAWIRSRLAYLNAGRIVKAVFICLFVFVLYGVLISLLLSTLWGMDTELRWYQFIWGFALAWVLGFITPGAPGGLGIREVILVGLYSQEFGEGLVLGLALILRVITSLGDLLAFGLAYWLGKRGGRNI